MTPESHTLHPIAHLRCEFPEKFGIPRQSGLVPSLRGQVVFTPPFRCEAAFRGIEAFSHLWLIWHFSAAPQKNWSPTVRPPRLGGNRRVGVFASRSPFRPNGLGLSCVRLERVEHSAALGPVLWVGGADLMDGTPIFDIKPYVPYADCRPEASGGFTQTAERQLLTVECPPELLEPLSPRQRESLLAALAQDPRPPYQHDPGRQYGMAFARWQVYFAVDGDRLTVQALRPEEGEGAHG